LNELRCCKVENLDDDRSDESKNEGGANSNGLQACVVGMSLLLLYNGPELALHIHDREYKKDMHKFHTSCYLVKHNLVMAPKASLTYVQSE
jgi:hypothetical protein